MQEQFAERINKTTKCVQNIEKAKSGFSSDTLFALCQEMELDPRAYYCPEKINTPDYLLDLNQLISSCTEEEAIITTSVVASLLKTLRANKAVD